MLKILLGVAGILGLWAGLVSFAAPKETPALLNKGQTLFKNNCVVCHGEKGQGITNTTGNAKPTQFALGYFSGGTNPENVYKTISSGRPHTTMPAFRKLSADDRWALTYYVLSLQKFRKKNKP